MSSDQSVLSQNSKRNFTLIALYAVIVYALVFLTPLRSTIGNAIGPIGPLGARTVGFVVIVGALGLVYQWLRSLEFVKNSQFTINEVSETRTIDRFSDED